MTRHALATTVTIATTGRPVPAPFDPSNAPVHPVEEVSHRGS